MHYTVYSTEVSERQNSSVKMLRHSGFLLIEMRATVDGT
jgi:hypothetical protein